MLRVCSPCVCRRRRVFIPILVFGLVCVSCGPGEDADRPKAIALTSNIIADVEEWSTRPGRIVDLLEDGRDLRSRLAQARKEFIDRQISDQTRNGLNQVLTFAEDAVTEKSLSLSAQLRFGEDGSYLVELVRGFDKLGLLSNPDDLDESKVPVGSEQKRREEEWKAAVEYYQAEMNCERLIRNAKEQLSFMQGSGA